MKSISARLLSTYGSIVIVAFLVLGGVVIFGVRQMYISNVEEILANDGQAAATTYVSYLSQGKLEDVGPGFVQGVAKSFNIQAEIYDSDGNFVAGYNADTQSPVTKPSFPPSKLKPIVAGGELVQPAPFTLDGIPVAARLTPLLDESGHTHGALVLLSSLAEVRSAVRTFALWTGVIGLVGLLVVSIAGYRLAQSMSTPIVEITRTAEEIAAGKYERRAAVSRQDEIGRLAKTINAMAADLGRVRRLEEELLSQVSHELRTPLTAIKGFALTALDTPQAQDPELAHYLQVIDAESDRLSRLVDDLLEASRLRAGRLPLRFQPCNPLQRAVGIAELISKQEEVHRHLLALPDPSAVAGFPLVEADPDRLREVFWNLLENAIKYTPEGTKITLEGSYTADEVCVTVTDNGPGISEALLPKMTEQFTRGESQEAGIGLGLYIVKQIVEAHGGHLVLHSEKQGTRAAVWLPRLHPRHATEGAL